MVKLVFFNELLPHHALHGEAEYLVADRKSHFSKKPKKNQKNYF
jgi:hypothetical protein